MSVHRKIERFLRRTDMPPTRFGRMAAGDPRLIHDLRNGRELGSAMVAKLEAFLAGQESAQ